MFQFKSGEAGRAADNFFQFITMLFDKWRNKNRSSNLPALVFDFGTSSVKILRCNYLPEKLEVLAGKKVAYPEGLISGDEVLHPELILAGVQEAVSALCAGETESGVYSAVVGVGGLSVAGFTSQINYRRAGINDIISEGEFAAILKKVETRADQIMRKLIAWETAEGADSRLVSSEILEFALDGNAIVSPVGKSGEKLAFTVYNSYTKAANFQAITRLISDLKLDLVSVSPTLYAQLRLLLENNPPGFSALLLDVGGKTSELGLVLDGRIIGHLGFDVAGESFSRSIAASQNEDFTKGEMLKLAYAHGKLPQAIARDLREVMATDCKVFLSGVELLLKEFPGLRKAPEKLFLSGGGGLLPGLVAAAQNFVSSDSEAEPGAAALFMPSAVGGFRDLSGQLNSPADMPILSAALDAADLVRV